jgi:hypothetical protein
VTFVFATRPVFSNISLVRKGTQDKKSNTSAVSAVAPCQWKEDHGEIDIKEGTSNNDFLNGKWYHFIVDQLNFVAPPYLLHAQP